MEIPANLILNIFVSFCAGEERGRSSPVPTDADCTPALHECPRHSFYARLARRIRSN